MCFFLSFFFFLSLFEINNKTKRMSESAKWINKSNNLMFIKNNVNLIIFFFHSSGFNTKKKKSIFVDRERKRGREWGAEWNLNEWRSDKQHLSLILILDVGIFDFVVVVVEIHMFTFFQCVVVAAMVAIFINVHTYEKAYIIQLTFSKVVASFITDFPHLHGQFDYTYFFFDIHFNFNFVGIFDRNFELKLKNEDGKMWNRNGNGSTATIIITEDMCFCINRFENWIAMRARSTAMMTTKMAL